MMEQLIVTRVLRPGDVVTVHCCHGAYTELPPPLHEGSRVTVVAVDRGYARVLDERGTEFCVAFPQIEMPASVWWHGRWIDRMTHPDGQRAFEWALGHEG